MKSDEPLRNSVKKLYRPRVIDSRIQKLISVFGGILITGPKWCGKSWTGIRHSSSTMMLGDKETNTYADLSPNEALTGEYPRLVDEWQDVPKLWDAARRRIDSECRNGMYIFTGSSFPGGKVCHTGAGRFARIEMRPLSLFESGDSNGSVSLSKLFAGGRIDPVSSGSSYEKTVELICKGGWPRALNVREAEGSNIPAEYIKTIISSDLSDLTGTRKDPSTTERVLRSLARNSASSAKLSTLAADVPGISDQTIRTYIDSLKQIYIIEEQPAWSPDLRSRTRIRTSPKIHFTDPSLAAAVLKATPGVLAKDVKTSGILFESLCYRDLCVYASALNGEVYHYRDSNDLEIDNIIELPDGRWGAVEVKLGDFEIEKAVKNLLRLKDNIETDPSFLSIITSRGMLAHTRDDDVSVIPIDLLGP